MPPDLSEADIREDMEHSPAHPDHQQTQPERSRPTWLWSGSVGLLLLGLGIVGFAVLSREPRKPASATALPPPIRTRVIPLHSRDFPVVVRSQGVARTRDEVALSAQVAGRVSKVSPEFEDGSFFDAGAVLVELEAEDFGTAVAMAQARVQSTTAAARLAELNQQRDSELLRINLLPPAQAEGTVAILAQAQAEADAALAQLERARRDLERTRIRAPFAGCVRRRTVGPGQWITPGATLGSIFTIESIEIRLPVSGSALAFLDIPGEQVHPGGITGLPIRATNFQIESPDAPRMEVRLRDSLATDPDHSWRGWVVRGEQALDPDTLERFLIVRVDQPFGRTNGQPPLRPGQPVTGFLSGRVLTNVLVLPRVAVRELNRIHLVNPVTRILSSRRVTPLWSDEDQIIVRDPAIPDGTLLVTTHLVHAPEGATVEIIPDLPAGATPTQNRQTRQLP